MINISRDDTVVPTDLELAVVVRPQANERTAISASASVQRLKIAQRPSFMSESVRLALSLTCLNSQVTP